MWGTKRYDYSITGVAPHILILTFLQEVSEDARIGMVAGMRVINGVGEVKFIPGPESESEYGKISLSAKHSYDPAFWRDRLQEVGKIVERHM